MANTITLETSKYDGRYMRLTCTQTSNGSTANSSTISWTLEVLGGNSLYYSTGPTKVVINGTTVYSKDRLGYTSQVFPVKKGSVTGTLEVPHNEDGTKSIAVSLSTAIYDSTTRKDSDTWELDAIPRGAVITQSYSELTETSVKINWSTDSTIDELWYSHNDGFTWTKVDVEESRSGSFTINELTPNNLHYVRLQVKRKSTQVETISDRLPITTYDYPHVTSKIMDFKIGDSISVDIYNPLSRTVTIKFLDGKGNSLSTDEISGTNISGFDSETFINKLYNSIPDTNSGKYSISVTYNYVTRTSDTGTYSVNGAISKPIFTNFEYRDSNATVNSVLGTNQVLVKGLSTLEVLISPENKALINAGSMPKSYSARCDTIFADADYSESEVVMPLGLITSSGDKRITVDAYDSRNNFTSVYKDITILDYAKPTVNIIAERLNNFEAQTTIKVSGTYTKLLVDGVAKNSITKVEYRYKATDGNWSSWFTVNATVSNGSYTCNDVIVSLDNTKQFDIEVRTTDKLDNNIGTAQIDEGVSIFFISTNKKACYSNGELVKGSLDVSSTELTEGEKVWFKKSNNLFNAYKSYNYSTGTNKASYSIGGSNKITVTSAGDWSRLGCTIPSLQPNTKYTVSSDVTNTAGMSCGIYESSGKYDIQTSTSFKAKYACTTDGNGNLYFQFYANFTSNTTTANVIFDNIQVQLGTIATDYEAPVDKEIYIKNVNGIYEEFINAETMGIETIKNDNGTAIKFPDGTLICTLAIVATDQAINTTFGSLYRGTRTWTYPISFKSTPAVTCGQFRWGTGSSWGAVMGANVTSATLVGIDCFSRATGTNTHIHATAIGRWK